jgi:hypothetical protein
LRLTYWESYLQHASFLPALHQNTNLKELASAEDITATTLNVNHFSKECREVVVAVNNILAACSNILQKCKTAQEPVRFGGTQTLFLAWRCAAKKVPS